MPSLAIMVRFLFRGFVDINKCQLFGSYAALAVVHEIQLVPLAPVVQSNDIARSLSTSFATMRCG